MARDPYEVVLADLRAKRDDIDKLIRTLETFRPNQPAAAPSALSDQGQPGTVGPLFGLSIVDASKTVLRERRRPMSVADIADAMKAGGHVLNSFDPANTISSVLNRAFQKGDGVVRVGRGTWALPDTLPPRAPEPPAPVEERDPIRNHANEPIDDDIPF